jgi:hypothetical protein
MIRAMRLSISLALALLCSPALAQPQPRIVLDVPLPPPPEHQLSGLGPPGRLAVGADGTHYVLASSFKPSADGILPAADARVEIMAFTRDGKAGYRAMLPVQAGVGKRGFDAASLGVAVLPSGDAMVFLSSSNQAMAMPQRERSVTSIYRVSAAGGVVRSTPVAPAVPGTPASFYRTKFYLPTSDNGLLVGGGFGPDPFNWWIGKFDTEGRRLWQAGPGPGMPEDVYGLALRSDGTISAVVQEIQATQQLSQWYVVQLAADGTPQGKVPFKTAGTSFALTSGGWVSAVSEFQTAGSPALVRLDANGNVAGSAPWTYGQTRRMIADGNGIVAIVCNTIDGPPCWIVRAGPDGKVRWQSQPVTASDIVRTPDGQIAAILWSDDLLSSRLVRFADP